MIRSFKKGFTLIELLVVISIISLLSSVTLAALSSARMKSRDAFRLSQVDAVKKALDLYYLANGEYPTMVLPAPITYGEGIPHVWQQLIIDLNTGGFIKTAYLDKPNESFAIFPIIKTAYAAAFYEYWPSPIQDPLYQIGDDYPKSFGYIVAADKQSYKIRIKLENTNNIVFNGYANESFLDPLYTSGPTACSKALLYYCSGRK